jgi:hypothetical protein
VQDFWSDKQHPSMDTGARETPAAAAAMKSHIHPRDETLADKDETDPFAGSEDEACSEDYADNPGKAMAKHVISEGEEEVSDTSKERSSEMIVDGDEAAEPAAASTPTRQSKENFRIVTIEQPAVMNSGSKPSSVSNSNSAEGHSGEDSTAAATAAERGRYAKGPEGDGNSAEGRKGEENSASSIPQKSDDRNKSDAGTAKTNAAGKSDGKKGFKIPSICPPPVKPVEKQAGEADAVPSSSYKAILNAKIDKLTPPAIPGIGPAMAKLDCGSFYNTGDNRIRRSVYKENIATLTVTSLSFNPVSWECASCPSKHKILEGGGG